MNIVIVSAALRLVHMRNVVFWMGAALMIGGVVEPANRCPVDGTSARREPGT